MLWKQSIGLNECITGRPAHSGGSEKTPLIKWNLTHNLKYDDEESSKMQRKQYFFNSRHVGFTFPGLLFPSLLSVGIFLLNLSYLASYQPWHLLSPLIVTAHVYWVYTTWKISL